MGLSLLVTTIGLRRRIRLLSKKGDGQFFLLFLASAAIAVPTIIAQNYIKAKSCKLTEINSVYDIRQADYKDCFTIKNFEIDKDNFGLYRTSRTSGKNNQTLTFYSYFVVPIIDKNSITRNSSNFHWLGIEFSENMSNHAGNDEKNQKWRSFYRKSMEDFYKHKFYKFQYLQGLAYSDEKDGYLKAVKRSDGSAVWSVPCDCPLTLIKAGGLLFAGGDGNISAHSIANGDKVWTKTVSGRVHGLAASNGYLFASTDTGNIYAFGGPK